MAQVDYLHVCDYAFSGEGGKQCVIGIFDAITAQTFPAVHPHMSIALRLRGQAHELLVIKIELGRPNGEVLATMQGEVTVGADGGAFMNVNLINVQFPESGRYTVKIAAGGETLVSHSIQLREAQATLQSAPPGATPKKFH